MYSGGGPSYCGLWDCFLFCPQSFEEAVRNDLDVGRVGVNVGVVVAG
jgi:hypothetical protein